MEYLSITIGEYKIKAKLHVKEAPETCRLLTDAVPIIGNLIQARWSGEAAWLQMDTYEIEAPRRMAQATQGRGSSCITPAASARRRY